MADEKKPEAKPSGAVSFFAHPDPFVEFIWTLSIFLVLLFLINAFIGLIDSGVIPSLFEGSVWAFFAGLFWKIFPYLKYIGIILSIILLLWAVHLYRKIVYLRKVEADLLYPVPVVEEEKYVNPQWQRILNHIETDNENDWKLAILEADVVLSSLLDEMSLPGDTMGDKLRAVEKSDFTTIDNAWEAHKIRNQIAHEGGSFMLTHREARRVIELYQTVFEEFRII